MDFLWEWKEKAITQEHKKLSYDSILIGASPLHVAPDQKALTNFSLVVLHSRPNGTARDKVTVIGRDQIGEVGTNGRD